MTLHIGWKHIAEALGGIHIVTAKTWYYEYGMPLTRTPGGRPAMTDEMILEWLKALPKRDLSARADRLKSHYRSTTHKLP